METEPDKQSKLKPCPFCGGAAEIKQKGVRGARGQNMIIACPTCEISLETGETWINENSKWNMRV